MNTEAIMPISCQVGMHTAGKKVSDFFSRSCWCLDFIHEFIFHHLYQNLFGVSYKTLASVFMYQHIKLC